MPEKKKRVVSFDKMDPALAAAFQEKYPKGYLDYLPEINKYPRPDGTEFHAVTVETDDCIALVKVEIKVDDTTDLERWLENEPSEVEGGESEGEGGELPDENISQYDGGEDPSDTE